ncbi:MAG TPA: AMP-dependent synthetase/ligase [Pyrinomonadaceae bacterium]|nr:AMP-dependent synthetase/ligase [Pyrinomonadaceae bacterium]
MQYRNIYQLFRTQTAKYRGKPVFYSRDYDNWSYSNWEDFEEAVHIFASALLAKGLTKSASVAILAGNIPEWTIADIGTIAAGGVGVGIYPTNSPEQCEYIINHSDAEFVVVDSLKQLRKVAESCGKLRKVKEVICLEDGSFAEFLEFGRQQINEFLPQIESIGNSLKPTDTAIMVYTSGTTGMPKGAMLSHNYILNSVESLRQTIPIFDDDICFSYLPFCHVAERISGLYNRLYNGTSVYFVDDLSKLYAYMLEVTPTVFASLPRFFEKIHAKIVAENGTDKVDSQTVKDAFGGRIRLLTSGGAALPNEVADFFAKANLPILQAYGLTENICVAFNTPENLKYGTVGKPMPMCEVKIAKDGEILVKSPMMFSGYYKEPEKTAVMFDAEGWLKTGDLGELDTDGFLKITGRKKEIIVLSSGKNVAPNLVENYVKENHLISQCFLYGDGKSYCVAIITLNAIEVEMFAKANQIEFKNFADLAKNEQIFAIVKTSVEKANSRLSSSEQIKKFVILERDFSLELDEITPTLKVKRNVVAKNFADEIENLYKN